MLVVDFHSVIGLSVNRSFSARSVHPFNRQAGWELERILRPSSWATFKTSHGPFQRTGYLMVPVTGGTCLADPDPDLRPRTSRRSEEMPLGAQGLRDRAGEHQEQL